MSRIYFVAITLFVLTACSPKSRIELVGPKEGSKTIKGDFKTTPEELVHWHNLDLTQNGVPGVSADLAYTLKFVNSIAPTVVVAVLDSGVDYTHPDLSKKMWVNKLEQRGLPGIDDDQNGFIDDIYGWNFLGNITHETLEMTRLYRDLLEAKKHGPLTDDQQILFKKVETTYLKELDDANKSFQSAQSSLDKIKVAHSKLKDLKNKKFEELTRSDFESYQPWDVLEQVARFDALSAFDSAEAEDIGDLQYELESSKSSIDYHLNINFSARKNHLNDDENNFERWTYGNNEVAGPQDKNGEYAEADHGTHVAGIIAAERNDGVGARGIAENASVMSLRMVPNGDEYDKDIYAAVKYAADNGARIINMSFGKKFSPHKEKLNEIFQYAVNRGVLVVHAAGNDSKNNDIELSFPNKFLGTDIEKYFGGWMTVGASSADLGQNLVARFSNFGKKTVELFAPGRKVYSALPGNSHAAYSGTSMAAPSASGVAALLLSQFPHLTPAETIDILMKTSTRFGDLQVTMPGTKENLVSFNDLSIAGGVVNAYSALKEACRMSNFDNCN